MSGVQGLIAFETEDHQQFRTLEIDGKPWFVVADICRALDLGNVSASVRNLDEDDLTTGKVIDTIGRKQDVTVTNESGLYQLIFQSRKPEAKKFKRWVTNEVLPAIRETGAYGGGGRGIPLFVSRFNLNWDRVDTGYFSVINELFIRVYGKLEQAGYQIPDKSAKGVEIRLDVSVGRCFSDWLSRHPDGLTHIKKRKTYPHLFQDGTEVEAYQYANETLALFILYVETEWLPNRAFKYFKERDQTALEYLPLVLPAPAKAPKGNRKKSA